jgi:hypothetical protein
MESEGVPHDNGGKGNRAESIRKSSFKFQVIWGKELLESQFRFPPSNFHLLLDRV